MVFKDITKSWEITKLLQKHPLVRKAHNITSAKRVMFLIVFVCLAVHQNNYLRSNNLICIKLLLEVRLGPSNNPLNLGDDPDYDPDPLHNHLHFVRYPYILHCKLYSIGYIFKQLKCIPCQILLDSSHWCL